MTFEIRDRGKAADELTPEQLAELNAAIAESERGEGVPAEEVLRELYAQRDSRIPRGGSFRGRNNRGTIVS